MHLDVVNPSYRPDYEYWTDRTRLFADLRTLEMHDGGVLLFRGVVLRGEPAFVLRKRFRFHGRNEELAKVQIPRARGPVQKRVSAIKKNKP